MTKPKLSSSQIIQHLKISGILFNCISEEDAENFIENSTYFFRLASYKKNFVKNNQNKYVDLDFMCLVELSRLDKKLRHLLFQLCIDVEHMLKTKVVQTVCSISDGYAPVAEYLNINTVALSKIQNQDNPTSYSHEMFTTYNPNFPMWVFVELASFGAVTSFCNFLSSQYNKTILHSPLLNSVRDLRNAVAHNSCMLRNIISLGDVKPSSILYSFASTYGIGKDARRTLTNRFVNDFVTLIYLHKHLINDSGKFSELKSFFNNDVTVNSYLFNKNTNLKRVYNFLKTIIDKI